MGCRGREAARRVFAALRVVVAAILSVMPVRAFMPAMSFTVAVAIVVVAAMGTATTASAAAAKISSATAQESERAGAPRALRVISFNIRFDTPRDEERRWRFRSHRVIEFLSTSSADFIGLQEVLPSQGAELAEALPNYGVIGRTRERSSAEGEANPIFFDRAKWALVESRTGTFWLSETPSVPGSKSWRSSLPRIATWGVFRERLGEQRILVLNTHWDHQSQEAREQSAAVIAEFLGQEAGDLPVIVMGDFNVGPANPARERLTEGFAGSPPLVDTFAVLHPGVERNTGTYHGFRGHASGPRIDAILASHAFTVLGAEIDRRGSVEAPLSDHYPVVAELRLKLANGQAGDGASGQAPSVKGPNQEAPDSSPKPGDTAPTGPPSGVPPKSAPVTNPPARGEPAPADPPAPAEPAPPPPPPFPPVDDPPDPGRVSHEAPERP